MTDHTALKNNLWQKLEDSPRPVTKEDALAIAAQELGLGSTELVQFGKWFEINGENVMKRLNGR